MPIDEEILQRLRDNDTSLTELHLGGNRIGDEGAKALAEMLERNTSLTELDLRNKTIDEELIKQIDGLIKRNQHYLKNLQAEACKQLKVARVLLYKTKPTDTGANLYSESPLEIKEKIVKHVIEQAYFTEEQQRLIVNYAEGMIPPVADKLNFFKVTKCDRVMKPLDASSSDEEPAAKRARIESSCSKY
jgi:hypothetical protein